MTLTTDVFLELRTAKDVVRKMFKKPCLRTSFESQRAKKSETLLKSARQHFIIFFLSLSEMELEISLSDI